MSTETEELHATCRLLANALLLAHPYAATAMKRLAQRDAEVRGEMATHLPLFEQARDRAIDYLCEYSREDVA